MIVTLDLDRATLIMYCLLLYRQFPVQVVAHVEMPTTQGRHANDENGSKTPRELTELMEVTRHPIAGIKGDNPSPRFKTKVLPTLETLEETSETEAINRPHHLTPHKTDYTSGIREVRLIQVGLV